MVGPKAAWQAGSSLVTSLTLESRNSENHSKDETRGRPKAQRLLASPVYSLTALSFFA